MTTYDCSASMEPFVSAKEYAALQEVGVGKVSDLLDWFPRRYEDRRKFDAFPTQAGGTPVCLRGLVTDSARRKFSGRGGFYEVQVEGQGEHVFGGSQITCRWFNMPYISKVLAAGHEVILFGKVKETGGRLVIDHPEFEIVGDGESSFVHVERIVPVYKNISGIPQRKLRELIWRVLGDLDVTSVSSAYDIDETYPRADALREVHFPESQEQAEAARRYFALEEFFKLQLNVAWRRVNYKKKEGRSLGRKKQLLTDFYKSLPFDLTGAQKRSVKEIAADMIRPEPMHRLLQGDVGSGKTFVALCAALLAVESGVQVAMMAPTQILAEQHYLGFKKWLDPLGVEVGLLTGSRSESTDKAQVIVGTHALLFDRASYRDVGLVIIDEQHKFGVAQRGELVKKGVMPDVLVMTATPIPRTLTLSIYGDLDVSVLDERPGGRGSLVTGLRVNPKVTDVTKFLEQQLEQGRQAYIVYPLVEESDSLKVGAVTTEYDKWVKRLKHYEVGLLHGRLSAEEKESVMGRFRSGKVDVLLSTTVVEVGVDVPNANLMVIYHAERFGLSQLHQLRGRIGRGEHKSYCILATDGKSEEGMEKLEVLAGTNDGFEIAEADLRLRGPGDVLGTQQSGVSSLRFVEFLTDVELIREARQLADELIQRDPQLSAFPALRAGLDTAEVIH